MPQPFLLSVALLCASAGALLALFPEALPRIEAMLNREWGRRTLFSMRVGLGLERTAEKVLNVPLESRGVVWDGWVRRHPRATGIGLLCLAATLLAYLGVG